MDSGQSEVPLKIGDSRKQIKKPCKKSLLHFLAVAFVIDLLTRKSHELRLSLLPPGVKLLIDSLQIIQTAILDWCCAIVVY